MFYKIIRPFLMLFMLIFYPRKIFGKENIPKENHVVVCNHFGKIDVFFIGSMYKGKTYFLAKHELLDKKLHNKIIRSLGGIPVQRDGVDLDCIREGLKVLKEGNRLAIFPEGKRNFTDTELQPLKPGSGMFAFKAKVPILPVIMEKKAHVFRRAKLLVGKPLYLNEYFGRPYNTELSEELNEKIREAMLATQAELRSLLAEKKGKR
ncbi:MAG: 1-acyl-sn-glycerol-3-phosphate acyltransferase [Clostridia bacterium]|nr:1-acyl-sn-glycerol-3-phosphate acyltransferase [Clostridia bacterium]